MLSVESTSPTAAEVCYLAAGDIMVSELPGGDGSNLYSPEAMTLLRKKDISSVNLEFPLTSNHSPIEKCGPNLSSPKDAISALTSAGFDIAVMANNHVMDHGPEAMHETVKVCLDAGITALGVGSNAIEAGNPCFRTINGLTLAFLAFAEDPFTWADEMRSGTAALDIDMVYRSICDAGRKADFVIVNVHAGIEKSLVPSPRIKKLYRLMVDFGADVVVGHHPHVIQGLETYKGRPIFYSLGNFMFQTTKASDAGWNTGLLVKILFAKGKAISSEMFVFRYDPQKQVLSPVDEEGMTLFSEKITRLSDCLADDSEHCEMWRTFCFSRRYDFINSLKYNLRYWDDGRGSLMKHAIRRGKFGLMLSCLGESVDSAMKRGTVKRKNQVVLESRIRKPSQQDVYCTLTEMMIAKSNVTFDSIEKYKRLESFQGF